MKRERIEDLGRIHVMVKHLMEDDLFNKIDHIRPKDFADWFFEQTDERKWDLVNDLAYGIYRVQEALADIYVVSDGDEEANKCFWCEIDTKNLSEKIINGLGETLQAPFCDRCKNARDGNVKLVEPKLMGKVLK